MLNEQQQARYDYLRNLPAEEMDRFRERELRKFQRMLDYGETEEEARRKVQQNG